MAGDLTPSAVMAIVDEIMSVRWKWGQSDCCTCACDVFHRLYGVDPMASVRGYSDAMGAARIVRKFGGFVAMAEKLASRSGLYVSDGRTGQIGVSPVGTGQGPEKRALLICIEPGAWAGKTQLGYAIIGKC